MLQAVPNLMVVLVLGLFFRKFSCCRPVFVSVLVRLVHIVIMCGVRMRMNVLMLMRMNQIAMAMLVSMFVGVLVDVGRRFVVFHCSLLGLAALFGEGSRRIWGNSTAIGSSFAFQ